ncbi:MAG: quinone oxidoreductase family protein [Ktedonobacteraceae bacterium]
MKAVQIHQYGGPEVMVCEEVPMPVPGASQVLVKIEVAGIVHTDTLIRTGALPRPLPLILGLEAAGTIEALGSDVTGLQVGDRVACVVPNTYAQYVAAPITKVVPIPNEVTMQQAIAAMVHGLTAHMLTHSVYPIQPGNRILIHAAAGGVGLFAVQMAKQRGAEVFGVVSTEEKATIVRDAGADHVIISSQADFEVEIKRLTDGQGVHAVYDSVGRTTFAKGIKSLHRRGYMVLFGMSSGPIQPFSPAMLHDGSLYLTFTGLSDYIDDPDEFQQRANDVLNGIASGKLTVRIAQAFPLTEAPEAHRQLGSRATSGKLVLIP